MACFHNDNNLKRIHNFDKTKELPYSYCLLKNKDTTRVRPIVSYYHHPLKRTFNYASRALAFVIKQSGTKNFTLWKTGDLRACLMEIQRKLREKYGTNTRFLSLCADIKNMYTELPHDMILKSIKFMLDKCQQHTRRGHVTLERLKHGQISLGRTAATTPTTHLTLSFSQLMKLCKFDIENTYFTSLGKILKQKRGVPMGSPGSPSYAICICSYYEHLLYERLKRYDFNGDITDCSDIVQGRRYIDDLYAVAAWDATDPATKARATHLLYHIQTETYHEFMKLKTEDTTNPVSFLEATLHTRTRSNGQDKITINYNNKNFDTLTSTGKLKLQTLQHRGSFINPAQVKAKIVGQLHRIGSVVTSKRKRITAIAQFTMVASHLGYTAREILNGVHHMATTAKTLKDYMNWTTIYEYFGKKTRNLPNK